MSIIQQNLYYDVIIIGAGISGIGAARYLQQKQISYIILQAQDKIGGRIQSIIFNGVNVDIGAYQLQNYHSGGSLPRQMKNIKWKINTRSSLTKIYYYDQFEGEFTQKEIIKVYNIVQSMLETVKITNISTYLQPSNQTLGDILLPIIQKYKHQLSSKQFRLLNLFINMMQQQDASTLQNQSPLIAGFPQQQQTIRDSYPSPRQTFSALLKKLSQNLNIQTNQRVIKLDYSSDKCILTTSSKIFTCKQVICSIPLYHLKKNTLKFIPDFPKQKQQIIQSLGYGIMNKILLGFEQPFWNHDSRRLKFACEERGKYSHFFNLSENQNWILCCFVTDKFSQKLNKMTDEQIFIDTIKFLEKIFKTNIKFKSGYYTRWEDKQFAKGSFSYLTKDIGINAMKKFRESIQNKIWMVGQYCYYQNMGTAHGAYQTGIWASQQIFNKVRSQKILINTLFL